MSSASVPAQSRLFEPGRNCQAAARATHASVLVDYANYYRALHEAISKAKHSVFALGWDVDSRIRLLRQEKDHPHVNEEFYDLICRVASSNPGIEIYLNRWDYSWFVASDREGFSRLRWNRAAPNIHFVLDDHIPFGACHHQKVVVVDDELAFCGGMDIALKRWDVRQHYPTFRRRKDPGGLYSPWTSQHYGPYHDVQMVVAGPIVRHFSQLVRQRWKDFNGNETLPLREAPKGLPPSWPESTKVQFHDISTAQALTMPRMKDRAEIDQIETLYFDMIERAERFIYIENQYLTHLELAAALNRQLKKKPQLRILLVSSLSPQGIMEAKSMWHWRVKFRDVLEEGGVRDRVALAYPISCVDKEEADIRIHSKLMAVDDQLLRIGSSNINYRSMGFDTECDLAMEAGNADHASTIESVRNDLIREHTGYEIEDIQRIVASGSVQRFLDPVPHSRQHLRRIDDEAYRHVRFADWAKRYADPRHAIF